MRKLVALVASVVLLIVQLQAQTSRTLTGKVTDSKGAPLVGVTVSAGSDRRTVTDNAGNFTIQVTANVRSLRFSYVGYNILDASISDKNSITVNMTEEDKSLSEVVVVGYGTQKKKEITGSIASVKGEALANKPTQSFDQALGGACSRCSGNHSKWCTECASCIAYPWYQLYISVILSFDCIGWGSDVYGRLQCHQCCR